MTTHNVTLTTSSQVLLEDNKLLRESVRQLRALVVALEEDLRKARSQAAACRRIHRGNG